MRAPTTSANYTFTVPPVADRTPQPRSVDRGAIVVLSQVEAEALDTCEQVIDKGLKTFVEVGTALLKIRDEQLYRTTYPSFESYCNQRWSISRPRAYQLMDAADIAATVSTFVDSRAKITRESHARELAPLRDEPERMREVWQEAVERSDGKPTAAVIREVREAHQRVPQSVPPELSGYFSSVEEMNDSFAMADAGDDNFEAALAAARDDDDMSRANVVSKLPSTRRATESLLEFARAAAAECEAKADKLDRVLADDSFERNREAISTRCRGQVEIAIEVLTRFRSALAGGAR